MRQCFRVQNRSPCPSPIRRYATVLAAVVVAGFLGQAVGIWASIFWGVGILAGLAIYGRKHLSQSRAE
jgi:hypothetical protein